MSTPWRRLAIVNRGDAAVRLIHAVQEYNCEQGTEIRTLALYAEPDAHALYVREADEAWPLGLASEARDPWQNLDQLEACLATSAAEAVWTGWGLVADKAEFVARCERAGLVLLGPTANCLRGLADSARLAGLAQDAGVPLRCDAPGARRFQVPVVADGHGAVWTLGVLEGPPRQASAGLVESPPPGLAPSLRAHMQEAARRLCRLAEYRSVAGVTFQLQGDEVGCTGVQPNVVAEHAVAEALYDVDLVKLQIDLARGGRLPPDVPTPRGHALAVRLAAQDIDQGLSSAPGEVATLQCPSGSGVRVDRGVSLGSCLPMGYDATLLRLVAHGSTRREALSRLDRALHECTVLVRGGTTNKGFLLNLLRHPAVRTGRYHADGLVPHLESAWGSPPPYAEVAFLAAALDVHQEALEHERARFRESAVRLRPEAAHQADHVVELRRAGGAVRLQVTKMGPHEYRVQNNGICMELVREALGPHEAWIIYAGRRYGVLSGRDGPVHRIEIDGVPHSIRSEAGGYVRAPSPAVVTSVRVRPGDSVTPGQAVVIVEAMKLETTLCSPVGGVVRDVLVMPNVQVGAGTPLVRIETDRRNEGAGAAVVFTPCTLPLGEAERLAALLLGYDGEEQVGRWLSACEHLDEDAQAALLETFADLALLAGDRAALDAWLRTRNEADPTLPPEFSARLRAALAHYGADASEESLFWLYRALRRESTSVQIVRYILDRLLLHPERLTSRPRFRTLLDRVVEATCTRHAATSEAAVELLWRAFDKPAYEAATLRLYRSMEGTVDDLVAEASPGLALQQTLVDCPQPLITMLTRRYHQASPHVRLRLLEVMTRRYYRMPDLLSLGARDGVAHWEYTRHGARRHLMTASARDTELVAALEGLGRAEADVAADQVLVVDLYLLTEGPPPDAERAAFQVQSVLHGGQLGKRWHRLVVVFVSQQASYRMEHVLHLTWHPDPASGQLQEERFYRGLHPLIANRIRLFRQLRLFTIERLPSSNDVYLYLAQARENPGDRRLFAAAEVRHVEPVRGSDGRILALPQLERMLYECVSAMRAGMSGRAGDRRPHWNRITLYVWPTLTMGLGEVIDLVHRLAPQAAPLGLHKVVVDVSLATPDEPALRREIHVGSDLSVSVRPVSDVLVRPLSEYKQKVLSLTSRGLVYPYEIVRMMTPSKDGARTIPIGDFTEFDLDGDGCLAPVARPYGHNQANIVVGIIRNYTSRYPQGMARVMLLGDPSRHMGALAEPECRRILAALDLAEERGVPLEWFALSSGARIAMDSGVENMDWISRVLRRIVTFTQGGGEINVVVNGINVGAQPYWNAEATMLMHTRGILIMTPSGAMVLTGKQALDYSGSVSAEDNHGVGGFDAIMGPNGQAQYFAASLPEACALLMRHYDHTWKEASEMAPRRAFTCDPAERDVCTMPYQPEGHGFRTVGDIFDEALNAERKKPFAIRPVMGAVVDQDHLPLERWRAMAGAETVVVWDAHLGGRPVCLLGIESRPVPRLGFIPADGPDQWTAGTLFPQSSRKLARALNAASGNRPVVVLANLSGFDGSPESMRKWQLEYGAEIGRAVVNFKGPIIFCVVSRYHGGAYVVFSRTLNENLHVVAVEGSFASVIGGAPAAAVVFAGDVKARTRADARLQALEARVLQAEGAEKVRLRRDRDDLFSTLWSEKLGEVAAQFDSIHTIQRALQVGAVDRIIRAAELRSYLIQRVEGGLVPVRVPVVTR